MAVLECFFIPPDIFEKHLEGARKEEDEEKENKTIQDLEQSEELRIHREQITDKIRTERTFPTHTPEIKLQRQIYDARGQNRLDDIKLVREEGMRVYTMASYVWIEWLGKKIFDLIFIFI
jgi:hypothetical protein